MDRFWSKVDKTDTCWLWTAYLAPKGYGRFLYKGVPCMSHRVSYELTKGDIPKGLLVLHTCDVRNCVNPDHLYLGTDKDNARDRGTRGRHAQTKKTHCPSGHEYNEKNMGKVKPAGRYCRECKRIKVIPYNLKKRAIKKLIA